MKPGKSNRKAFTLVEILIVICVISILFVVLVSRVDFATDKARTTGAQNDLRALQMAIHQVALEDGELIDDLDLLASRLNENLDSELMVRVENNELVSNAKDPWGSYYKISYSKPANSKGQAVVISAGPDMKYSSSDDVGKTISCKVSASGMNVTVQDTLPSVPGGSLPVEPDEHICNFSKAVQTTEHIKTAGNCSSPVVYFYSCECGANGTATFTGPKDLNTHVSESTYNYNSLNEDQHTSVKVCSGCNTTLDTNTEMHSFSNNVCTKCGHERHVHSYIVENATEANKATSATCTAKATYYYTCACGAKGTSTFVSGNELAHNYSGRVTTDPTCTATGVRTYTCSTCSNSYTELVEKTPHNYNKQIEDGHLASPATCKDYAKYYWSCVCGANSTKTFDGTVLSTTHTGGTETKYEYVDENTHKVSSVCKTCTAVIATSTSSHGNIVNNACSLCNGHMHSFTRQIMSDYTRVTEATCQAQATYRYSCADTNCDVLSDASHVFAGGEKAKHQSTIGGTSDVHTKCSICGTTISVTHDYTTTITKDETCTESGTKKHTCTCGYSYTETINKLGHDIVSHAAKDVTCTTNGYAAYDTCSRCNYTTYKEIVATGHKNTNGGTSAIHTKCSECGATTSSKHSYSSKITVAATCTSKGTTTYTCSCGYSYSAQDVAENASNHTGSTTYQYSNITVYTHTVTEYCGGCKVKLNKDSYEENHSKTETCKCGYIKYDMLNGSQQTVNIANNNDVTFCSEADYNDFKGLYIDNSLVDSSNYTVTEGSTIITIKAAYMSNMKDGEHTIDIASTNGMASTTFEVVDTKIYALSGKWQFNDTLTQTGWASDVTKHEHINFTVVYYTNDGSLYEAEKSIMTFGSRSELGKICSYFSMHNDVGSNGHIYAQYHYAGSNCHIISSGIPANTWWDNISNPVVDFGTNTQTVSQEFYEWFTTNAKEYEQQVREPGVYETGTSNMLYSWQYLLDNEYVFVNDGVFTSNVDSIDGENKADGVISGELVLPNDGSITELGEQAFAFWYGLENVVLPDSLAYIGACAFESNSITKITLPKNMTVLGANAFWGCGASEIILPENLEIIESCALFWTYRVESITIPYGVEIISDCCFGESNVKTIYLPNTISEIQFKAFRASDLELIVFDGTIEQWNSIDFNTGWNEEMPDIVVQCLNGNVVPESIHYIGVGTSKDDYLILDFISGQTWNEWLNSSYNKNAYYDESTDTIVFAIDDTYGTIYYTMYDANGNIINNVLNQKIRALCPVNEIVSQSQYYIYNLQELKTESKLIEFVIGGGHETVSKSFYALEGMTWGEWLDSEFNMTGDLYYDEEFQCIRNVYDNYSVHDWAMENIDDILNQVIIPTSDPDNITGDLNYYSYKWD